MAKRCEQTTAERGEDYIPCGEPAPHVALRGPHGGGVESWPVCDAHARALLRADVEIEGVSDCEGCGYAALPGEACDCAADTMPAAAMGEVA